MKSYTCHVDIDLPREKVVELFDSQENCYKWQDGLQSFDLVEGEAGQPGARSKIVYLNGKHRIEMFEVITAKDLPDTFDGYYEWATGKNTLKNRFIELAPDKTRWESTCDYEFSSLMLKFMGLVAPGLFRRQNQKFLDNFKAFCETGADVREKK